MLDQRKNSHPGQALIFSGPHGAGKDTLETKFRQSQPTAERVVRHITRPAAPNEINGKDYHFVETQTFRSMIEQDVFIEHATYPDCMSGTSRAELMATLDRTEFATFSANFEDALSLHSKLGKIGVKSTCFFISPVPLNDFLGHSREYLIALEDRMIHRDRPADRIVDKLAKAVVYRDLYIANEEQAIYVDNSEGYLYRALQDIARVVANKK